MRVKDGTPIQVSLQWDKNTSIKVGDIAYRDGIAYLEHDQSFLESDLQISPLHHPTKPGLIRPYDEKAFEGLHGVFADSLPDGWGRLLLDRRARQLDINPAHLTPLDRLAVVGNQAMGALVYEPMTKVWGTQNNMHSLDQLAQASHDVLEGSFDEVIQTLGKIGGSPGGARPKALISIDAKDDIYYGWQGYKNEQDRHFLVKFRGHQDPIDIAQIEMSYAEMARDTGIEIPETRLLTDNDEHSYFAIERFDNVKNERRHIHTASGLLYANINIPSLDYKDLIQLTRFVTRDQREVKKMYRLAVFNVLSHNRDDHARQFSFSMDRTGTWKFAPAYDLTWSAGPGGEHSTSVLGYGKDISLKTLKQLGLEAEIGQFEALDIIEKTRQVISKWKNYADRFGVSKNSTKEIERSLSK